MSKKGKKKSRSEKNLANILLATAIIDLLTHIIDFLSALLN